MTYFNNNEDLKKQYRELCKKLHPDHGGDPEEFKKMMEEYEEIKLHGFKKEAETQDIKLAPEMMETLRKVIHLEGVEIELVGTWLWLSGNTYQYKEALKTIGFKWSPKRKRWFFTLEKGKGKFKGDFEELKAHHGSVNIKGSKVEKIA